MGEDAPDRIGQCRHLFEAARHRLDARFVEQQPIEEGRGDPLRLGGGNVARIGGEDFSAASAQRAGGGEEGAGLGFGRGVGERARRLARLGADGAHRRPDVGSGLDKADRRLHESLNPANNAPAGLHLPETRFSPRRANVVYIVGATRFGKFRRRRYRQTDELDRGKCNRRPPMLEIKAKK